MYEPCAVCGEPVDALAATEARHKAYHGACYQTTLPKPGDIPSGVALYSHDEKVRDGVEQP